MTPLPQPGNPTPRVFRLPRDGAVINRLGFNNGGHAAALRRLKQRTQAGVVGVNIGANKDATDRVEDYVRGLDTFYDVASYFTINISSPNTPGLRDLQDPAALEALLGRLMTARAKHVDAGKPRRPIVVKLAPDIDEQYAAASPRAARRSGRRRHRRFEYDAVAQGIDRSERARGRRPVRSSAVPSLHRDARARLRGDLGKNPADRHRRNRLRRERARQDRGWGDFGAALYRPCLRRARPDRAHQGGAGRGYAARRCTQPSPISSAAVPPNGRRSRSTRPIRRAVAAARRDRAWP